MEPTIWRKKLTLEGHTNPVCCLAFTPDGKSLVSAEGQNNDVSLSIRIWDFEKGIEKMQLVGHKKLDRRTRITSVIVASDGKTIISAALDRTIRLWDIDSGKEKLQIPTPKEAEGCSIYSTYLVNGPAGTFISFGYTDGSIIIHNVKTGKEERKIEGEHGCILQLALSDDNKSIVLVGGDNEGTLKILDFETGKEKLQLVGHKYYVRSVAFSPDNLSIVSCSGCKYNAEDEDQDDCSVRIWDCKSGKQLHKVEFDSGVNSVAFSADGLSVVSGQIDKTATITPVLWLKKVAASVHDDVICPEIDFSMKSADAFDWKNSNTAALLESCIDCICNTRDDDGSHQNIIHVAAKKSCSKFLSNFLDPELYEGMSEGSVGVDGSDVPPLPMIFPVLAACLVKDAYDRTPLYYAIESQNPQSVSAILEVLLYAFKNEEFTTRKIENYTCNHLFELVPFSTEFGFLLEKYPGIGLKFFERLKLLDNYDSIVKKDCAKAPLSEDGSAVFGSEDRAPDSFWKMIFYPGGTRAVGAREATVVGVPVSSKFIPIKGAAALSPEFNLLHSIVDAAEDVNNFGIFENEIIENIIDFKWNSHVKSHFLQHMCLDILMIVMYSIDGAFGSKRDSIENLALGLLAPIVTLLLVCFFVRHEVKQFLKSDDSIFKHITSDIWNAIDFLSLSLILLTYIIR